MKHTLELKEISETESVCKYINILNLEQEHVFAKLLIWEKLDEYRAHLKTETRIM